MSKDMHTPNPDYVLVQTGGLIGAGCDIEGNYQEFLESKGIRRIYENGKEVFYPMSLRRPEERLTWKSL